MYELAPHKAGRNVIRHHNSTGDLLSLRVGPWGTPSDLCFSTFWYGEHTWYFYLNIDEPLPGGE
jgi:hypothetical protein